MSAEQHVSRWMVARSLNEQTTRECTMADDVVYGRSSSEKQKHRRGYRTGSARTRALEPDRYARLFDILREYRPSPLGMLPLARFTLFSVSIFALIFLPRRYSKR